MGTIGFVFGISGMTFGLLGYIFSLSALNKIKILEERVQTLSPSDETS